MFDIINSLTFPVYFTIIHYKATAFHTRWYGKLFIFFCKSDSDFELAFVCLVSKVIANRTLCCLGLNKHCTTLLNVKITEYKL